MSKEKSWSQIVMVVREKLDQEFDWDDPDKDFHEEFFIALKKNGLENTIIEERLHEEEVSNLIDMTQGNIPVEIALDTEDESAYVFYFRAHPFVQKLIRRIYADIEVSIESLVSLGKTPEEASETFRNTVWEPSEYASYISAYTQIEGMLALLNGMKIPKKLRDGKFEKNASHWACI